MPERVTREERRISLLIEKARNAKEELLLSLENNRSPVDDESEEVKLKRPKAENYEPKFVSNDGPTSNHAYAGDVFKKGYGEPSDKKLFNALGEITKSLDSIITKVSDLRFGKQEEVLSHLDKAERIIDDATNQLM